MEKYPQRKIIYFSAIMCTLTCWFHGSDYFETSRAWITHLVVWISGAIPLTGLCKLNWAQVAWINPLSTSLNFFTRALVTGLMGTWIDLNMPHLMCLWQFYPQSHQNWKGMDIMGSSQIISLSHLKNLKIAENVS